MRNASDVMNVMTSVASVAEYANVRDLYQGLVVIIWVLYQENEKNTRLGSLMLFLALTVLYRLN